MGFWKKTLVYLDLVDEDELDEGEDEFGSYDEEPEVEEPPSIRTVSREEVPTVRPVEPQGLGQVHVVEPRSFDADAQEIGDKMKGSVPVIMNLQGVEEDLFKRLTAFASGLAYGLDGSMQRLAPRVYLITPANVEVSAEDRRRLVERGVFDEL